jgi:hypothetical protein
VKSASARRKQKKEIGYTGQKKAGRIHVTTVAGGRNNARSAEATLYVIPPC